MSSLNWAALKKAITEAIKTNNNQEITADVLQGTLMSMIQSLGENATFAGIATPSINLGLPGGPTFYLAATAGTYSNGLTLGDGEIAALIYNNGSWQKQYLSNPLALTETQEYSIEKNAGRFQAMERVIYNTEHNWQDGDKLVTVLLSAVADNSDAIPTELRIYNSKKELKATYVLGTFNTSAILQIDIRKHNITLSQGDIVAIYHGFYIINTGSSNYYDLISDSIITDYIYSFGFIFERNTQNIKEIALNNKNSLDSVKKDIYGDYTKYMSTTWDSGFINVADEAGIVYFKPVTTLEGWKHKIIECEEGDAFDLYIKGGSGQARAWSFLDADRKVLQQESRSGYITETITAPANSAYLVLNTNTTDSWVGFGSKPIWQQNEKKSVRILCLGNSYSQDSMSYVPWIIKSLAPQVDITIGIAVIAGCSLAQHLSNLTGTDIIFGDSTISPANYTFFKSTNGEAWKATYNQSVNAVINNDSWDIITLQQNSGSAYRDWDVYFAPFIHRIHKELFTRLSKATSIGWLLTHTTAYGSYGVSLERLEMTQVNSRRVMETTGTTLMFPYGTAVQNLRTTSLRELGDGDNKNLTWDDTHLQEGIGCLTAAYTNALTILKYLGLNISVIGDSFRVDDSFIAQKVIPGAHGTVIGMTDDNVYLAQVSAELAVKYPYQVTAITEVYNN